jgi:hypothetical protein
MVGVEMVRLAETDGTLRFLAEVGGCGCGGGGGVVVVVGAENGLCWVVVGVDCVEEDVSSSLKWEIK